MPGPGWVILRAVKRWQGRLIWVLLLGVLLRLGTGCGVPNSHYGDATGISGGMRWAGGDTARVLRNAQYFKLMGQPDLGIKELEATHRLNPGNLEVADALAQYYDDLGLGAQAQQIYREALARAPDSAALQNNLGFSYYQAGKWSEAETCYRQTLSRQPNNPFARNNLGLVLCRQGRQDEARQLWQETQGEEAAAQKLSEALAALGMPGENRLVQQNRTQSSSQPGSRPTPPKSQGKGEPVIAAVGPPPAQGSLAAVKSSPEIATPPATPLPGMVAAQPTRPSAQVAPNSRVRELPKPQMVEDRVSPAPPPKATASGLSTGIRLTRPLPPRTAIQAATATRPSPAEPVTPAKSGTAIPRPALASQPASPRAAATSPLPQPRANPKPYLNARELTETSITILNGNGTQDLARTTRSQLHLEGYNLVAINNFRDFGVDRTVIYYRPEVERVATELNKQFFPGAELKSDLRLADSIDVKVVLGHDLHPQQQAAARQRRGLRL
jgi:hypothetical protein